MHPSARVFLLHCLIIFFSESAAQEVAPSFRHYTTEDGLPSSEIYCILQDKQGRMWFGTDRGVSRFDGYEFQNFTYKDGLTDNTVFKLFQDNDQMLWMYTYSGRIFFLRDEMIYPYTFNKKLFDVTHTYVPYGFYVDSINVHASIRSLGEIKIDTAGTSTWKYHIDSMPGVNYIIDVFDDGTCIPVLLSTINKTKNSRVIIHRENEIEEFQLEGPAGERIVALILSKDRMLFSIANKLYEKRAQNIKLVNEFPGKLFSLLKDNKGNIFAGSESGVYVFDENHLSEYRRYLEKNSITSIFQDSEGGYWFSTLDNGVYYIPGYGVSGIAFTGDVLQKPVSIASDRRSAVYAGLWNGAVVKIKSLKTQLIFNPSPDLATPITNLTTIPGDPHIYVSSSEPGYIINDDFTYFRYKYHSLGIKTNVLKRRSGSYYCAGSSSVVRITGDSAIEVDRVGQRINCVAETRDNKLLVGSNRGAYVYDESAKKIWLFHPVLYDVRVDDIKWVNDYLCFATKGKGVIIFHKDTILRIDERYGLISNLVSRILVAENDIWCTTNKGLSHIKIDVASPERFAIININGSHGLFSDQINDITYLNDTIYLATNTGISFFPAKTEFINHEPPPVAITGMNVNQIDTTFSGNIELEHSRNNIQIRFNGISYRSDKKLQYKYALITGNDTLESVTANREVEFFSLKPGDYRFEVSAMNSSGVWSTNNAMIKFVIHPAWWQTIWFRLLLLLGALLSGYGLYRNQIRRMKEKFEMEKRQASLQLTAIRAQMNPHFIFNVMNSIRNYMQDHDMRSAEKYLTSFSKLVRYTLDNSEVQETTLEEELNALRNYAELEMQRFENGFEFSIQCDSEIDLSETTMLSMLLQPYVENAIKHGISRVNRRGIIKVDVRKSNNAILIAIEDNGVGTKQAAKWNESNLNGHISHGTSLTGERINAYNKVYNRSISTRIINLTGEDGLASGTRIEIEL